MRAVILLLALFLFSNPLLAEKLDGWQSAKWGMSDEEILKSIPGSIRDEKVEEFDTVWHGSSGILLPTVPLARGHLFKAYFVKYADRLNYIVFSPLFGEDDHARAFDALEEALTAKYGEPLLSRSRSDQQMRLWRVDQTAIKLESSRVGNVVRHLSLVYQSVAGPDTNKL
jgi:hypothetical protein